MLNIIKEVDEKIFLLINQNHCSACDFIFFWASDRWIWIPFYAVLMYALYRNAGRNFFIILMAVIVLIVLSDQFSVLIKNSVMRYRPCHNLILQERVHLVNEYCGGIYGFVSSHAANTSALSLLLILFLRKKIKWITPVMISWCFFIGYSRIYLGQHFPADIIGGWILGIILAALIFYFNNKFLLQRNSYST